MIHWFMKNPDVKLPSRVTESRGSNDVKIYIPPSLLFHLSPLSSALRSAFLCFGFTFRQAFCTCWQNGQRATPRVLPRKNDVPTEEPIRGWGERMENADWPGSPIEPGLLLEPHG